MIKLLKLAIIIKRIKDIPGNAAIYDLNGQKVLEIEIYSEEKSIDISSLNRGIYVLQIENSIFKLVVQ